MMVQFKFTADITFDVDFPKELLNSNGSLTLNDSEVHKFALQTVLDKIKNEKDVNYRLRAYRDSSFSENFYKQEFESQLERIQIVLDTLKNQTNLTKDTVDSFNFHLKYLQNIYTNTVHYFLHER